MYRSNYGIFIGFNKKKKSLVVYYINELYCKQVKILFWKKKNNH